MPKYEILLQQQGFSHAGTPSRIKFGTGCHLLWTGDFTNLSIQLKRYFKSVGVFAPENDCKNVKFYYNPAPLAQLKTISEKLKIPPPPFGYPLREGDKNKFAKMLKFTTTTGVLAWANRKGFRAVAPPPRTLRIRYSPLAG